MSPSQLGFPLTSTFFGLKYSHKKPLLEEVYVCIKHLGATYNDVLEMPTYIRRFFIESLKYENQARKEKIDEVKSTGKGTRSKTISGETLKAAMKRGDIPTT